MPRDGSTTRERLFAPAERVFAAQGVADRAATAGTAGTHVVFTADELAVDLADTAAALRAPSRLS